MNDFIQQNRKFIVVICNYIINKYIYYDWYLLDWLMNEWMKEKNESRINEWILCSFYFQLLNPSPYNNNDDDDDKYYMGYLQHNEKKTEFASLPNLINWFEFIFIIVLFLGKKSTKS